MHLTSTEKKSLALVVLFLVIGASARFIDRRQVQWNPSPELASASLEALGGFTGQSRSGAPDETMRHSHSQSSDEGPDSLRHEDASIDSAESTGEYAPEEPSVAEAPFPIDINSADVDQWDRLKGVGPKTAAAIVEYRRANGPFRQVDDLLNVKGIGKKKLESMRPHVIISGE